MVRFAPQAQYRVSKRGLVLAGESGDTVLFEHPRAADFPTFLADDPDASVLAERLGPPLDATVIDDLVDLRILTHHTHTHTHTDADAGTETGSGVDDARGGGSSPAGAGRGRGVRFTRSGIMFPGIAAPSRWIDRWLLPVILNPLGALVLAVVVIAGIVALLSGGPDLPSVSSSPAVEALLMVTIGMAATICHELAHAVAMVRFGRTPRRAGFGFYWGALSFFVDSTPAMTLPRHQRAIQALVGLAVDVVTTAVFAIAAYLLSDHPLIAIVLWRLAILSCVDIVINLAPILQVDGHWALADWLDEPDLGPRARRALGAALRGRVASGERWLAAYGGFSLLAGLVLIAVSASVFWVATGDLVLALFTGNVTDVLIGIYYVGPLVLGLFFSTVGLILEAVLGATGRSPDTTTTTPANGPTAREDHQP